MEKSCQVIEILFWIGIGIVFYTYLGYGIVLYLMVKIKELFVKPRSPRLPEPLPEATLLIAAYNEEAIVASKMVNCRQLDYPADKLRLVWITDGSNDNTNERLKEYPEVTVLYQPRRQGKTAALNRAIPYVKTPYVIFTDANTMLNKGAIKEIIRQFSDPRVGCVAGEKRVEYKPSKEPPPEKAYTGNTSPPSSDWTTGYTPPSERQASSSPSVPPSSSRCPRIPCWTISSSPCA